MASSTPPTLHPTAIWGQDSKFIFLTLNLADTKVSNLSRLQND